MTYDEKTRAYLNNANDGNDEEYMKNMQKHYSKELERKTQEYKVT